MHQLQDYLTRAADRWPDAGALVMGDERWTYGELETFTNRFARMLRAEGCRDGSRVCVLASKSPATVASLVAVLKAGGVYVPIDSASPTERVARILSASEPDVVLVDSSSVDVADGLVEAGAVDAGATPIGGVAGQVVGRAFTTTFDAAQAGTLSGEPLGGRHGSDALAHLLFTSGSTGIPKGVMITHANAIAFVEWAVRYFGIRPTDRVSGHPPLHFDLSTFDIYGTLAAGAELHLVPSTMNPSPRAIADLIRGSELTQWFSVPSVLTYLIKFNAIEQDDFPALERLLWCGEVLPTPVLAQCMRLLPHVRFTNLYGPTEATIASSYFTVPGVPRDETVPIPIGVPCGGEDLHILDDSLQPVEPDEIGHLYISGAGLSPGYWRDPEKTAAAFLTPADPLARPDRIYRTGDLARRDRDGVVHFLGRVDSQIKSRGYRIELGEIEAAVNATSEVRECAVVGVDVGGFEGTTICCAYSVREGCELPPMALRSAISRLVPAYMLPSRWRVLDNLPKNVNGKIDRSLLREQFRHELTSTARAEA
ncbi:amino acid adenylation domain-containing protein [Pseudonocardia sp. DSM 110487]|nr:amino acid adenylation domain-containing protein [Pseudonocardia sp. DSM 110487]